MALRASLGADFSDFSSAIKNVEVQLKTVGEQSKNAAKDLTRMAESLSGSRVAREAELMAEAVQRLGGASRLTEAEQRKVNATVTEALAKYRALGESAPAHLQKLAKETSSIGSGIKNLLGPLSSLAGAFGIGFSVQAVVAFGKELLKDADALTKLSEKTGIAVEPLQRLKFAAEQSGVGLDQVTSAVSMLQKRMAEGDDSAVGALRRLGIGFDQFMAASPDEQFKMIATEVAKIENPMQRVRVATELFGKSGAELLPLLIADLDALGASAAVMSERTVASLDRVGDRIDQLVGQAKVMAGEVAVVVFDVFSNFGDFVVNSMGRGIAGGVALTAAQASGRALAESAIQGMKDGFGVLASSPDLGPQFDMFSDKSLAKTRALLDRQTAEMKKASAEAEKAAEAATSAWMESWNTAQQVGRDAATDFQSSFKKIGGMIVQVDASAGKAGKQFEFLKWQLKGVHDTTANFMPLMPALKGNLTDMGQKAEEAAARVAKNWRIAADVLGEVSRAAEMAGHKTTAAMMSIGAAVAQAAPGGPWAMALAGGMALFSTISDKLFKTQGKQVNDLRDAYISAAGGFEALNEKARQAGMTINALLQASTVKDYEAAVASLNSALEKTAALQGELTALQAELAGRQVMDWKAAEELIAKYGGTLGHLGQQFVAAKDAASWKTVWDDWQTLIDMGADVGGVLVNMQDEIQALVQASMRIGTEIPEQFKPLIANLIETGQLFDVNGKAITDMSGLKFGAPLVSEVDKIITKIDELITALTRGLAPAIAAIPDRLSVRVDWDVDDFPDMPGRVTWEGPSYATGGVGDFGTGTLAMLHGREAIIPLNGNAPRASDPRLVEELQGVRADNARLHDLMDSLPRTLARAMRDVVLMTR